MNRATFSIVVCAFLWSGLVGSARDRAYPPAAADGAHLFDKVWRADEGLGPLANAQSCVSCHATPEPGGSGTTRESMVPLIVNTPGIASGAIFQQFTVDVTGPIRRRPLPATFVVRRPPPLFGLGLLEAVPDATIVEYADPDDADHDGVSGRLPRRNGEPLRFGWKAKAATVDEIVGLALVNELGLTPSEIGADRLAALAAFVRQLDAPRHSPASGRSVGGRELFLAIGCATCHRPALRTGASPIAALAHRDLAPYTDVLLHDMGGGLADGVAEGEASEREFRTPPLWNVAMTGPPYLHDGRAPTLLDAVRAHGGEAQGAAGRFEALPSADQLAIVEFLKSL